MWWRIMNKHKWNPKIVGYSENSKSHNKFNGMGTKRKAVLSVYLRRMMSMERNDKGKKFWEGWWNETKLEEEVNQKYEGKIRWVRI